jgi:hypothetical protein
MSRDTAAVGLEFADLRRDVVDNISWLSPFDWSVAYEHPYETGPLRQLLRHSELAIPLAQSISRIPSQFLSSETIRKFRARAENNDQNLWMGLGDVGVKVGAPSRG